jgi:hypothetical protein
LSELQPLKDLDIASSFAQWRAVFEPVLGRLERPMLLDSFQMTGIEMGSRWPCRSRKTSRFGMPANAEE